MEYYLNKFHVFLIRHLRDRHCTKEGGSYVCRYGFNGVCASLPLDGVSDRDYETHVAKYHVNQISREPEWSVFSAAQNLAAVLNDPSRGKQTNLFTKKWGDSFVEKAHINPSQYLPNISLNDFDNYLKKIGKRHRRHLRIQSVSELNSSNNTSTAIGGGGVNTSATISTSSHRIHQEDVGNLNEIPQIFFKPSLDLSDPNTFGSVFPGLGNDKEKQTGRLLQEKLSHYLDIVEVCIAKQVSQKSSAFFHAMTSQDAIMEEMNEAANNVKKLRSKLRHIDSTVVKDSLKILQMARTRQNYVEVIEKLKLMATVHQTQPMIQLLLGTQDYVAALDLISTTQEIVAQELIGVHCFRHLPMQLKEMERLIDKMLVTEFERYSTTDLNRPLLDDKNYDQVLEEDKLVCIVLGLLREKNFSFIDTYKDEAIVAVKAVIKQIVIELIASSDAEACLTGAGEEAQNLNISEWIQILERATTALLRLLNRVKLVHDVMEQTADASAGKADDTLNFIDSELFLSESDNKLVKDKLKDMLLDVCNYCHERCANLVSSQYLEKDVATAEEIEKLAIIVNNFSKNCESISGIQSIPLKQALKVQAQRFAQKFHAERKNKLALLLDSERWKQVDIPNEFQKIIDRIANNDFNFNKFEEFSSNCPTSPVLLVNGKPFTLVGAALLLVQIVSEYCRCAIQLPMAAGYLSRNVVDLLRTFNSRSCQLILGAGALHVAGLKTITSSNLALVSRALQLILWLLPIVKSHFKNLDPNSISGYDIVEKDYLSHIKEIENKVLNIVTTLVNNQLISWEAKPPIPSKTFRNISRHFVKLHEAIAPILPEEQIYSIYRIVHKNFKDKLREQLLKNNIIKNGGPQHGVVTSELIFYMETLRTLKALPENELNDDDLEDIWLQ